jgi:hypothetical protein
MRGGAFLNGKEGRVGFRKKLLLAKGRRRDSKDSFFNGKEGRAGFRKKPFLMGKSDASECNENSFSNCRVQLALSTKKAGMILEILF